MPDAGADARRFETEMEPLPALRLSEALDGEARLLRDAVFDRTGFVTAAEGDVLGFALNRRFLDLAPASPALRALIVPPELADHAPERLGLAVAEDPEMAFYRLHNRLARDRGMRLRLAHRVDPTARIHPSAVIETGCRIGPDVEVGPGAVIHAGVALEAGARVMTGAVVGGEGYFCKRRPGEMLQAAHAGGVRIGPDAIVMAGAQVQRGVHCDWTEIGARAVVGPLTNISHGARLGDDASVAGGAEVSGYVIVGDRAWIGPGAVISHMLRVGADARVEIGSVVVRDVAEGARISGFFAAPHEGMRRLRARLAAEGEG